MFHVPGKTEAVFFKLDKHFPLIKTIETLKRFLVYSTPKLLRTDSTKTRRSVLSVVVLWSTPPRVASHVRTTDSANV